MRNTNKKKRGFTLVELLVVIAIIGLLASIVFISLGGARKRARDARRQSDMRQVATAMEMYYSDQTIPAYPTAAASLQPNYLPIVPTDPLSGSAYTFVSNAGSVQSYCMYGTLEAPSATTYVCASQKGVGTSVTVPTLTTCCL